MTNDMKNNKGNFAQNPERAREAGRKGGEASHGEKSRDADIKDNQNRSGRV
jgi:general stress protein YciG